MPTRKHVGTENLVGQRVVALRIRQGVNQKTLLARLQVRGIDLSQSALSDIEGQRRKVSDRELLALADSLGVSLEALFASEET